MQNKKKLCKSSKDDKLFGVCGGIAEYLGISSFWIRLIWCIVSLIKFEIGLAAYIICAIAMPDE